MGRLRARVGTFAILFLLATARVSAADLAHDVGEMFEAAWKPSPTGLKAASARFTELCEQHPADVRIKFGYALLLVKNRRYDDATKLLGEILAARSNCFPARQTRIWTRVLTKEYDAAILDMDELLTAFPTDQKSSSEAQWVDLSSFLGAVTGFLAGPAEVPDHSLVKFRTKVAATLRDDRLNAFTQAEQRVADRFAEFGQSQQETKVADKEKAVAKNEELSQEVDQGKEKVAATKTDLEGEANRLRAAQDRELQVLTDRARPVQQALFAAQGQVTQWSNVFANAQDNLDYERSLDSNKGRSSTRIRNLESRLGEADANLRRARAAVDAAAFQLAQLEQARQSTLAKYTAERIRLEKAARTVLKEEKRLAIAEKTLSNPIPNSSARSRSLALTATVITSYEDLPFERMREQLFDSLRNAK